MLAARTHRTHIRHNTLEMHGEETHDSDAHNTLLHKQDNIPHAFATRLSTTLHRHLTPFRCLTISLSLFLLFFVARHNFSPTAASPSLPLPVACCTHTSYHRRLQIVVVGDSITEYGDRQGGWVSLLSSHYVRHADIYNRGYGGYNTRTYLALLHQHLNLGLWPYQPTNNDEDSDSSATTNKRWKRLVTLYLGTNDAALPDSGTKESRIHTPVDEFAANLRSIIALLVPQYGAHVSPGATPPSQYLSTSTALILVTPGQVNITQWQLRNLTTPPYPPTSSLPITRSVPATEKYAAAVRSLARDWHIPCLDMWPLTAESEWQRMFSDGLHLSDAGNRVVYDEVMRLVREEYGELEVRGTGEEEDEVGRLDWDAPIYWQIDYQDIEGSFAVKDAAI